jgi:hypothetical protein
MGKPVEDDLAMGEERVTSTYAEELQLYIPSMVEPGSRPARRSAVSRDYFRFEGRYSSSEFSTWQWESATKRSFGAV